MHDNEYLIRVRGRLPDHWAPTFSPLELSPGTDGTTDLHGPLPDQAALHGVLSRIGEMGVELLLVRCPRRGEVDR